jgi:Flp pilus assembly protein CpaB
MGESVTLTILQDIRVFEVDTRANVVTLELKPEEAQKLALPTANHELRLVLRAPGDDKKPRIDPTKADDIFKHVPGPGPGEKTPAVPSTPPRKEKEGLAAVLPPGYRAIAIKVALEGSGGFVLPGARVDVIWVAQGEKQAVALTILQNVLVLANDVQPSRKEDRDGPIVAHTVTLAATPEDCQKLLLAAYVGELRLALRPPANETKRPRKMPKVDDLDPPEK